MNVPYGWGVSPERLYEMCLYPDTEPPMLGITFSSIPRVLQKHITFVTVVASGQEKTDTRGRYIYRIQDGDES